MAASSHSPPPVPEEAALSRLCISTVGYSDLKVCVDKLLGVATPSDALPATAGSSLGIQDAAAYTTGPIPGPHTAPSRPTQEPSSGQDNHEWDLAGLTLWHRTMLALLVQSEGVQRSAQLYSNDVDRNRFLLQQFQMDTGCDANLSAWYLPHSSWHYPSALISWHHDMHQLLLHRARSSRTAHGSYFLTRKQDHISTVRRKAIEAEKAAFIASAPTAQPGTMDAMAQHHRRVKFQALTQLDSKAANRFLAAGGWDVSKAMDVYLTECAVQEVVPLLARDVASVFRDAIVWRKTAAKKVQEVGVQAPALKDEPPAPANGWSAVCLAALSLPGRRVQDANNTLSPADSVNSEQVFAEHMKDSYLPDTPSSASSLGESHLDATRTRHSFHTERHTLLASQVESDSSESESETPLAPHPEPSMPSTTSSWQPFAAGDGVPQHLQPSTASFRSNASWAADDTPQGHTVSSGFTPAPNLLEAMGPAPLAAPHHSIGSLDSIQSVPQAPTHPWGAPGVTSLHASKPSMSDVYQPGAGGVAGVEYAVPEHEAEGTGESPSGIPASRRWRTAAAELRRSGAFTEYISPSELGPSAGPDRAAMAAVEAALLADKEESQVQVHSRTVVTSTSRPLSPSHANNSAQQRSLAEAIQASLAGDLATQSAGTLRGPATTAPGPFGAQGVPSGSTSTHSNEANAFFPAALPVAPASPRTVISPPSHSSSFRSDTQSHDAPLVSPRARPATTGRPATDLLPASHASPSLSPQTSAQITPCESTEVIHTHALVEEGLLDDDESYPLSPRDSAGNQEDPVEPPTLKVWTKGAQEQQQARNKQSTISEIQPATPLADMQNTSSSVTLSVGPAGRMMGSMPQQNPLRVGESTAVDRRKLDMYDEVSEITPAEEDVEVSVKAVSAESAPGREVVLQPVFTPGAIVDVSSPPPIPAAPVSHIIPPGEARSTGSAASSAISASKGKAGSTHHSASPRSSAPDTLSARDTYAKGTGFAGTGSSLSPGEGRKDGGGPQPAAGVEQYFTTSLRNWVDPVPHLLTSPLAKGISAPGGLSEVVAPTGTTELPEETMEAPPPTGTMELPPLLPSGAGPVSHTSGPFPVRRSGSIVEVPFTGESGMSSNKGFHPQGQPRSSAPAGMQYTSTGGLPADPNNLRGSITNAGLLVREYPASTLSSSSPAPWQGPGLQQTSSLGGAPLSRQETGSRVPSPPQLSQSNSIVYRSLDDNLESVSTGGSGQHAVQAAPQLSPLNVLSNSHGMTSAPELQRSSTLPYRSVAAFDADFTLAGYGGAKAPYQAAPTSLSNDKVFNATAPPPPGQQYTGSHHMGAASGAPSRDGATPPGSSASFVRNPVVDVQTPSHHPTGASLTWTRTSSSQALPPFLPDSSPDYAPYAGQSSPIKSHYTHMPHTRSPSTDLNALRTQSSMGSGYGSSANRVGSLRGVSLPPPRVATGAGGPLQGAASGQLPHAPPASYAGSAAAGGRTGPRLQHMDSFDQQEWEGGRRKGTTNLDDLEIPNWF